MKNIFLKSLLILTVSLGTLSSCVNSDEYSTPESTLTTYELTTTTTVAAVNAAANLAASTATPIIEYTADDIIEAYVTSNDEAGTFYKAKAQAEEQILFKYTLRWRALASNSTCTHARLCSDVL